MVTFIAIYRGESVATAQLVAVTADPELVAQVASALLGEMPGEQSDDPALHALRDGKRRALRLVHGEAVGGTDRDER